MTTLTDEERRSLALALSDMLAEPDVDDAARLIEARVAALIERRLGEGSQDVETSWVTGPENAARFVASVSWPWEREANRDDWAPKMLTDPGLFAIEAARARARLRAALAVVENGSV